MRWSCPHCGTMLALSDDKVGSGWAFSRCFKCAGHALIRRPEVNVIKVDRAPAGERVLLPETNENPSLLSASANERLESLKSRVLVQPQPRTQTRSHAIAASPSTRPTPTPLTQTLSALPDPLPELKVEKKNGFKWNPSNLGTLIPAVVGALSAATLISGLYLLEQGQSVVEHTKQTRSPAVNSEPIYADEHRSAPVITSATEPQQVLPRPTTVVRESVAPEPVVAVAPEPVAREVLKLPAAAAPRSDSPGIPAMKDWLAQTREQEIKSRLEAAQRVTGIFVQPKGMGVRLRELPSVESDILGVANPRYKYVVTEWADQWFKILIPAPAGSPVGTRKTAWIRNDQILIHSR